MSTQSALLREYGDSIPPSLVHRIEDIGRAVVKLFDERAHRYVTKDDGTLQTSIDTTSEKLLVEILSGVARPLPILAEEDTSSRGINLAVEHPFFWSIDPIDGTSRLAAGFKHGWSISVGAILNGMPAIGVVALPRADVLYVTANVGGGVRGSVEGSEPNSLLGLSLGVAIARNEHWWEFNRRLIDEFGSLVSEPSVQSGIDFITGRTRLFVACNSNHWDLCAIAALALEQGAVVRHCDGTQIDWSPRRTKFPPVVFARTKDDALRVTRLYFDAYEYIHPHDK